MDKLAADPVRAGRQLDLRFSAAPDGTTFLSRQIAGFPFHITRPFMLDRTPAGMATLILQSVGAGIVQGDRIDMAVEAGRDAAVHLTTQASTIVHGMTQDHATQTARVVVRSGAFLEYLPDALILFPRSHLATRLELVVEPGATLMWCDGAIMHDPKGGEGRFAHLAAETVLTRGDEAVAVDRFDIDGATMVSDGGSATAGYPIHATFGVAADTDLAALTAALRDAMAGVGACYAGISRLPHDAGVWCRLLARDGVAHRKGMEALWRAARRHLTGDEPPARRK
jgi:urease accessory protein